MGFRPGRKTWRITFDEGHNLHGLELRARGVPVGQLTKIAALADSVTGGAESLEQIDDLYEFFCAAAVSWNVETDDGTPVPLTVEALQRELDLEFVLSVITAWMETIAGTPDPLGAGSRPGGTFPEASIPMEVL